MPRRLLPHRVLCQVAALVLTAIVPSRAFAPTSLRKHTTIPVAAATEAWSPPVTAATEKLDYNWRHQWYALTYASYVPQPSKSAAVTPAAVFGEPLVLWREQDNGEIYCAADRCAHRAAALSEGRLRNGVLTCLYHGWQYSGQKGGACVQIPQLAPKAAIPRRACLDMKTCRVEEGIVWVWMGTEKPTFDPPVTGELEKDGTGKGWFVYDFMCDLPYEHSYLVENLLDPAHIDISHDKTIGGGSWEAAEGYEMIVDESSMGTQGFKGKFRKLSQDDYRDFAFDAPGIVRNKYASKPNTKGRQIRFEAALHCTPLAIGRSRLFFRTYAQGLPWLAKFLLGLKPKWMRHLNSCKVLEQDVGLITTQEDHFMRHPNHQIADDFLLIQSSDGYVQAYRRWLDRVGHGMPWWQGLATAGPSGTPSSQYLPAGVLSPGLQAAQHRASNQDVVETRYHRHVVHCPITRNALRNVRRLKHVSAAVVAASASVIAAFLPLAVRRASETAFPYSKLLRITSVLFPISAVIATWMHFLEREFYTSFKRKEQLSHQSGMDG